MKYGSTRACPECDLKPTQRVLELFDIRNPSVTRPSIDHIKELGQIHLGRRDGFLHVGTGMIQIGIHQNSEPETMSLARQFLPSAEWESYKCKHPKQGNGTSQKVST